MTAGTPGRTATGPVTPSTRRRRCQLPDGTTGRLQRDTTRATLTSGNESAGGTGTRSLQRTFPLTAQSGSVRPTERRVQPMKQLMSPHVLSVNAVLRAATGSPSALRISRAPHRRPGPRRFSRTSFLIMSRCQWISCGTPSAVGIPDCCWILKAVHPHPRGLLPRQIAQVCQTRIHPPLRRWLGTSRYSVRLRGNPTRSSWFPPTHRFRRSPHWLRRSCR
mmetsp:Transcript_21468/g.38540  ORF Transcript_21468/g.38540 Transcript_21468/m.38540 type:complete len:220 (+) Transcript_21468:1387-2046(+)